MQNRFKTIKTIICLIISISLFLSCKQTTERQNLKVWSKDKASEWYAQQPWLVGCNFQPSSAINQIEMWQSSSFDSITIETELGWVNELGFNTMRVYLSSVVWKAEPEVFKKTIDKFLTISARHDIRPMFVFFDECWKNESTIGKQDAPKLGVHSSGWVQDPSVSLRIDTTTLFPELEKYVKDIIYTFKNDKQILMWDLYIEPENNQHGLNSLPLLKNVYKWVHQINPSQPLSASIWLYKYPELNIFQIRNSDNLTYHNYQNMDNHVLVINLLRTHNRPMIRTEYMARGNDSKFQNIMPLFKKINVGAINWGFVSSKTNTIFAWDEPKPEGREPSSLFNDMLRQDKTAFDPKEVNLIKKLTGKLSEVKLMNEADFEGKIDGKEVSLFSLKNKQGMVAQITNFGGRVVSLWTADNNNNFVDVVTGFNSLDGYLKANEVFFGAIIGRYGNRIANGKFNLDDEQFQLPINNGLNTLHGGPNGFHNVVWDAHQYKNKNYEDALELKYISPDGEEGFPGNLSVTVVYTLTNQNELKIEYSATTDKPTVINLTNHSFFNLHGFSNGVAKTINSHILQINAANYTPTDKGLIPTGVIVSVNNTPMDFLKPLAIGKRVNEEFTDLINGKGYDHNWVLIKSGAKMIEAAVIFEPSTGIQMRITTDQPGLQFYGGNFFEGKDIGKYGEVYNYRTSFALETQHYPDSPNQSKFPSTVLNPGEKYKHVCIYKLEIIK